MKNLLLTITCIILISFTWTTHNIILKQSESKNNYQSISKEELSKETIEKAEVEENNSTTYNEYIENISSEIVSSQEVTEKEENKLKSYFILITDFIFYDGKICNTSFKELSNEAKERIINIYVALDNKLETKSPRYKEKIATTSKTISKNVINEAKNIKDKIKEEYKEAVGEEAYNNTTTVIEDDIKRVKENALPTVNTIKEKSHDAYVEVKDTLNNWYQEFKESGD